MDRQHIDRVIVGRRLDCRMPRRTGVVSQMDGQASDNIESPAKHLFQICVPFLSSQLHALAGDRRAAFAPVLLPGAIEIGEESLSEFLRESSAWFQPVFKAFEVTRLRFC